MAGCNSSAADFTYYSHRRCWSWNIVFASRAAQNSCWCPVKVKISYKHWNADFLWFYFPCFLFKIYKNVYVCTLVFHLYRMCDFFSYYTLFLTFCGGCKYDFKICLFCQISDTVLGICCPAATETVLFVRNVLKV